MERPTWWQMVRARIGRPPEQVLDIPVTVERRRRGVLQFQIS